jgi:hypothetical protein
MCYYLSRCFSWYNIDVVKIPNQIDVQKVSETTKYENMRFFISRKLNIEGGDFVRKSQKLSKMHE